MQYCFVAVFSFVALEALQVYAVMTKMISSGGVFPRWALVLLGTGLPLLPTGIPFAIADDHYPSQYS